MKLSLVRTFTSIFLVALLLSYSIFSSVEPALATAATASNDTVVTLNVTAGISLTGASTASMSQSLGITANVAVGTTSLTVITNDLGGYILQVKATSTPAMVAVGSSTMNIPDYQTGTPNTWNATSGNAFFGYSAFGSDVPTATWGDNSATSVCYGASSVHATSTALKYKGFTTSNVTVGTGSATTTPSGTVTNLCYAVEQKNYFIPVRAGVTTEVYQATVVATATTI